MENNIESIRSENVGSSAHDRVNRRFLASFPIYQGAQLAVDELSDEGFDVDQVTIVGHGLNMVEEVTGVDSWWRSMARGAWSGAGVGVLIGLFFGFFDLVQPLVSALILATMGAVFGLIIGAVAGLIGYSLTNGDRDFTSLSSLDADHYDVLVEPSRLEKARQILARSDRVHATGLAA